MMRATLGCLLTKAALLTTAVVATAGEPEYAKLRPGMGVSISGEVGAGGLLVADEIERLPSPRSPKLRGPVTHVDPGSSSFVLLGQTIHVTPATTRNDSEEGFVLDDLEVGTHAEVRCRVVDRGPWVARSVSLDGIKTSSKLKGTVGRIAIVKDAPDSLFLEGLPVLLLPTSDLVDEETEPAPLDELFAELKAEDGVSDSGTGIPISDQLVVTGSLRQTTRLEQSYDLRGPGEDSQGEAEPGLRLELAGRWSSTISSFVQLRAQRHYVVDPSPVRDDGTQPWEIELRQAYAVFRNIAGAGFSITGGKQRIKDEREFLFDEYLDAVRVYMHRWQPIVLEASFLPSIVPLKDKSSTWNDVFLRALLMPSTRHSASAFLLRRWDEDTTRNRQPVYLGLTYHGKPSKGVRAWCELTWLRGEDKGRTLRGNALDVGAAWTQRRWPGRPTLALAYASASGDDDPDPTVDAAFHQTGYEDNSSRLGGLTNFRSYGEVLQPELTNLEVWTIALGARPLKDLSVDLIAHGYRQRVLSDEMDDVDVFGASAFLTGASRQLGHELDLVVGARNLWRRIHLSYAVGAFWPGDAFRGDARRASLHRLDLRLDF